MKKRAFDYVIISAPSLDALQNTVKEFLDRDMPCGWYPSGSPVYQKDSSGTWHQAMYAVCQDD